MKTAFLVLLFVAAAYGDAAGKGGKKAKGSYSSSNACTPSTPCADGVGDCDANDDCIGALVCVASSDGALSGGGKTDYCGTAVSADNTASNAGKSGKQSSTDAVSAQAPVSTVSVQADATAAPAAVPSDMCSWILSTVSGCPEKDLAQCYNLNIPYNTMAEAKTKCGELSATCGAIMAHNDGNFYLRRASDPTRTDPGSKLLLFPCTDAAKRAFVDNNDALKTGAMSAAVTSAANASNSTMSMVTSLAIAFVAVGAAVGAVRKFQSMKHTEYTTMDAVAITENTEMKPITATNC